MPEIPPPPPPLPALPRLVVVVVPVFPKAPPVLGPAAVASEAIVASTPLAIAIAVTESPSRPESVAALNKSPISGDSAPNEAIAAARYGWNDGGLWDQLNIVKVRVQRTGVCETYAQRLICP